MINNVSFGAQDFKSLISEPPANARAATAAAASVYPNDTYEKKGSLGGKIVKLTAGAAIIAGTLALLRGKVGSFKNVDLSTGIKAQGGIIAKAKYGIAKAGQAIIDGFMAVKSKIPFLSKKTADAAEAATEAVAK